jgi:hypothetical protein
MVLNLFNLCPPSMLHYSVCLFAISSSTSFQYLLPLFTRNDFPYLIMTRKADEAIMPMKAAEIKQFW